VQGLFSQKGNNTWDIPGLGTGVFETMREKGKGSTRQNNDCADSHKEAS